MKLGSLIKCYVPGTDDEVVAEVLEELSTQLFVRERHEPNGEQQAYERVFFVFKKDAKLWP